MTLSNISKGSYIDIFFVNQFSVLICPRVAKQIFKWRFWQMLETFTLQKSISKIDFRPLKKFWKVLYGQAGQDLKQPDLEKDVSDMAGNCFSWSLNVPSSPNYYTNLCVGKKKNWALEVFNLSLVPYLKAVRKTCMYFLHVRIC